MTSPAIDSLKTKGARISVVPFVDTEYLDFDVKQIPTW